MPLSCEPFEFLDLAERLDRLDALGALVREEGLTGGLALHAARIYGLLADDGRFVEAGLAIGDLEAYAREQMVELLGSLRQERRAAERGTLELWAGVDREAWRLQTFGDFAERCVRVAHGGGGDARAMGLARIAARRHWAFGAAAARTLKALDLPQQDVRAFARKLLQRHLPDLPSAVAAELMLL